jgi:hypothetical protein
MASQTLDYLIADVRVRVGDLDATAYRYLDATILQVLSLAVRTLGRWWNYKYLVDVDGTIYRNPNLPGKFLFPEPPVIEPYDEPIIALMASLLLLEGSLENSAWSTVSWRDAEISFSNLEGGRLRDANLNRLWNELTSMITPPSKKLAQSVKGSLPGYKDNSFEQDTKY